MKARVPKRIWVDAPLALNCYSDYSTAAKAAWLLGGSEPCSSPATKGCSPSLLISSAELKSRGASNPH
jgi:hypothetical protein